jgi:hypothetical protein
LLSGPRKRFRKPPMGIAVPPARVTWPADGYMGATRGGRQGRGGGLKRISLVVLAMAALAVVAPATALGRDAPADREPGGPTARASWAIVVPAIGLAVRLAAGPASRAGAGIVAGIIGRRAPQVGKIRTSRAIKDARTSPEGRCATASTAPGAGCGGSGRA